MSGRKHNDEHLISVIRFAERRYLWACHLYYHEDGSPVDDADHDATERQLELTREHWSDYFKSHLSNPDAPLKTQAHSIRISDEEKALAHQWAGYIAFLSMACSEVKA